METSAKSNNKGSKRVSKKRDMTNIEKSIKLVSVAEGCMETLNFDAAKKACDKALEFDPNNCSALELKSSIAMEAGEFEMAIQCLDKSISIAPFSGFTKYLSRAQISTSEESLYFYNKGIDIIKLEISKLKPAVENGKSTSNNAEESAMEVDNEENETDSDEEIDTDSDSYKLKSLIHELSSVYCNIAELYMTDLCDEDEAQELCQKAIEKAIEVQHNNPEPFVIRARFEIILGDVEAALVSIMQSTILWFPKIDKIPAEKLLNCFARHNTAKVLIELKQHSEAQVVLETLLEENDQVVDLWYLMGWNRYLEGEQSYDIAKEYLTKAKKVEYRNPCEDEDVLQHIDELLNILGVNVDNIDYDADSDDYEDIESDGEDIEKEILEGDKEQ